MDGIILVDKPAGISSFGVVARVRWQLSQRIGKKVKVGHTGTLDPFATGLMIIVVGSYCKRASEFSHLDKTYDATAKLGTASSTGDPEGELSAISEFEPTRDAVEKVLAEFTGEIIQTPPIYSAIKINGRRAYDLARAGERPEMPERKVMVKHLELVSYNYPEVRLRCDVSSGTYIRSLVESIGAQLGIGAYTSQLRRLTVGEYSVNQAQSIDATFTPEQV